MRDVVAGVVDALSGSGRFVLVAGHDDDGLAAVAAAASGTIRSPGPSTRLGVGAGVLAGGHRPVVVTSGPLPPAVHAPPVLAVTGDVGLAARALAVGWPVVQPSDGRDVASLLGEVALPALLVATGAGLDVVDEDLPRARPVREWERGRLATLAASGAAVEPMLRLGLRLRARGVDLGMLELAVLSRPEHVPLAAADTVLVAGRNGGHAWRRGEWPQGGVGTVSLAGVAEADLVGAVLALVPAT